MDITFLIGNGFDRNLGLDTTYSDFVKYYKETEGKTEILKKFRQHISENEELWSAAEIEMGKYTNEFDAGQGAAFSECHIDFCEHLADYLKDQVKRIDYNCIESKIEQAFSNINNITKPFTTQEREEIQSIFNSKRTENIIFNFINYNYTDTLEQCVSKIKKKQSVLGSHKYVGTTHNHLIGTIQHVHGTVDEQMVFGVNDESQIKKPDIFECEYGDLYKNVLIKKQANDGHGENTDIKTKEILDKSQILYIYGMSIGETDQLWWERVCAWLHNGSTRRLIIYRHGMAPRGLLGIEHKKEERIIRRQITQYAKLDDTQKSNIEKRIYVTGVNIFEEIKNAANRTDDEILRDSSLDFSNENAFA